MQTSSEMVVIGGKAVQLEAFAADIGKGDRVAERLLVQQLTAESTALSERDPDVERPFHSNGLLVANAAYRGRIVAHLKRLLDGDEDGAEECWGWLLERVLERIDRYDHRKAKLRTWVFNQALYAALDYRRMYRDSRARTLDGAEETLGGLSDFLEEPLTARESAALRRAMRRLTVVQRTLIWRRYVQGMTPVEIARSGGTDIPEEQVKVYIFRALRSLRTYMDDEVRR